MGNAKARGPYERRKANPQGPAVTPPQPTPTILAYIEKGFEHQTLRPILRRATAGGYVSKDGRAYYFDGKSLRRVTHAMPTGEDDGA